MDKRFVAGLVGVTVLAGAATVAVAHDMKWEARPMVGANEVPARVSPTNAEARAEFKLKDGVIEFRLRMREPINNAFMGHIHSAPAGVNGPIVAWVFGDPALVTALPSAGGNPAIDFGRRDVVARGEIRAENLVGPLAGHPLEDLIALLNSGNAYVN